MTTLLFLPSFKKTHILYCEKHGKKLLSQKKIWKSPIAGSVIGTGNSFKILS